MCRSIGSFCKVGLVVASSAFLMGCPPAMIREGVELQSSKPISPGAILDALKASPSVSGIKIQPTTGDDDPYIAFDGFEYAGVSPRWSFYAEETRDPDGALTTYRLDVEAIRGLEETPKPSAAEREHIYKTMEWILGDILRRDVAQR